MSKKNEPTLRDIFLEAAEIEDRSARSDFLNEACGVNSSLRQRVEELLAADKVEDGRKEMPTPATNAQARVSAPIEPSGCTDPEETLQLAPQLLQPVHLELGVRIGRYRLREKVGEGGCGVVYVADQEEPVRRRVALKVIKAGMDTRQVVARFEVERQALALMDHPNIAKVLDGGATDSGRPYFVMELVRGIRITDYCDQNHLATRDRLELFIKVCQAIQHAHQKGVIHRDIKPSNILVTLHDGIPVPKVIDFGIAKATEGRLGDATIYTQLHQFIGTPAYMSPEQAEMSGLDIDTRSDIYSLGVLLYELLVGSTPFDPQELIASGIDAMRRTIREKEPLRPSTRLGTLNGEQRTTTAKLRSADALKLANLLKGDLDWIVMKCLEKDRTHRYETANGLAADLRRHLNHEPVTARPPTPAYRFQKAFRRNKVVFAAAGATAMALLLGILASTWQAMLATRATQAALQARADEAIQRTQAERARANEAELRLRAEAQELTARQKSYASAMNLVRQALAADNVGLAQKLLYQQSTDQPGRKDLRGWEWRYLWQYCQSDALGTLPALPSEVTSLAFSPDRTLLAIGRERNGLVLWNLRTRSQELILGPENAAVCAAFSPAGSLLAFTTRISFSSVAVKSKLYFWDVVTRQFVAEIPLDGPCAGLRFSEDGRTLVTSTASPDGRITLWEVATATRLRSYPVDLDGSTPVTGFAVTSNLRVAAFAKSAEGFSVIDLRGGGEQLWSKTLVEEDLIALEFSPDGKTLASNGGIGGADIMLWEVGSGKQIGVLQGHRARLNAFAFWPDGKTLASAGTDQTIRLWDLTTGKELDVLRGHRQEVWRLALLADGKTLVSGCKDGSVCFWDASAIHHKPQDLTVRRTVSTWCFTPDGQSVLTLDPQGRVGRWFGPDFQQEQTILETGVTPIGDGAYHCFSGDGRLLAVGSASNVIKVWDVARRALRCQFTNVTNRVAAKAILKGADKLLCLSVNENVISEVDLNAGTLTWSSRVPAWFSALAVSPDERMCAMLGYGRDVTLKDLLSGKEQSRDFDIVENCSATFSSDGKLFAVGSHWGDARVWDTQAWKQRATLGGFLKGVHSVAFSPDNRRLAASSGGKEAVKVWDVDSWEEVLTLEAEGSHFRAMTFSPDGNAIGSLNASGMLHLWRAPSWQEISAAEAAQKAESQRR
jgi:eukaryotic-like serine/threonine-protein kinase